jgi:hypothetical protein
MSTTRPVETSTPEQIEVLSNEELGTVTYVADLERDSIVPPTEWITVDEDTTVDVLAKR